jgi:glutathione peroxidase
MPLHALPRWFRTFFAWRILAIVGLSFCAATASAQTKPVTDSACPALLRYQFPRLQDDSPQNLCQYSGRVLLVVNTASYCGFTSQYEGLEALYAKYEKRGLVVLGFPSNDFGKQEPGNSKEIADFCFNTYGVKFPMFAKTVVTGAGKSPFYVALTSATGATPQWNFHKFLIDRSGKVLANFPSEVEPQSPKLVAAIEQALR